MKKTRFFVGLILILSFLFLLVACGKKDSQSGTTDSDPSNTTVAETSAGDENNDPTTPVETDPETPTSSSSNPEEGTNPGDETDTDAGSETEGESETTPPTSLTAEELKSLLSAALNKETGDVSVTSKAFMNGEVYSENTGIRLGGDFYAEVCEAGYTERITVVGDKAYYFCSVAGETESAEARYVMTLTADEKDQMFELYMDEGNSVGLDDDELTAGILNSILSGVRYADGAVELTCVGLDDSFVELLFGMPMEDAELSFDFKLDGEGRIIFMRFTVTMSAELTGDEAMTIYSDTVINYAPEAIAIPEDAADYVAATYDDIFGIHLPEADPDDAASAGLPLDKDHYTFIGENSTHAPAEQYMFMLVYPHCYEGKTFTLYGTVLENSEGHLVLSLGNDMEFVIYFDGVAVPTVGSYVKLTAVYTKTVDMGAYADFDCFTMMVTECEVLGEAVGPNGGKLMYITASSLNVRTSSDTSTSDNILGQLSHGELVEVFEQDAKGWYRIVFNGQNAYISNKYVSETKP